MVLSGLERLDPRVRQWHHDARPMSVDEYEAVVDGIERLLENDVVDLQQVLRGPRVAVPRELESRSLRAVVDGSDRSEQVDST